MQGQESQKNGLEARWRETKEMVGTARFELATPCTPSKCATRLRYVPMEFAVERTAWGSTSRFYTRSYRMDGWLGSKVRIFCRESVRDASASLPPSSTGSHSGSGSSPNQQSTRSSRCKRVPTRAPPWQIPAGSPARDSDSPRSRKRRRSEQAACRCVHSRVASALGTRPARYLRGAYRLFVQIFRNRRLRQLVSFGVFLELNI